MISGWLLVLAALLLLPGNAGRAVFACAGLTVEVLGLGLLATASRTPIKPRAAERGGVRR